MGIINWKFSPPFYAIHFHFYSSFPTVDKPVGKTIEIRAEPLNWYGVMVYLNIWRLRNLNVSYHLIDRIAKN